MRVERLLLDRDQVAAHGLQLFADFLKRIGDGAEPVNLDLGLDYIKIPFRYRCSGIDLAALIEDVWRLAAVPHCPRKKQIHDAASYFDTLEAT